MDFTGTLTGEMVVMIYRLLNIERDLGLVWEFSVENFSFRRQK